ncbi:hypothetical protein EV421DRAFT_2039763 [Armillaria borealis]|uniref:C2H2-type domain-containing protein n=1 Tax=Armillaria borealis TaxID=47425 RepID=A0AA39J163_9AGAR|nr:hypothetical protein EV421DRAFT_2039763 [Armillaria borealis]
MPENISLPSIHEMFPEHLLRIAPEVRIKSTVPLTLIPSHSYVPPPPLRRQEQYSFDFHRSGPAYYSSLSRPYQPLASGVPLGHSRRPPPTASEDAEDDGKRFICTICNKRFGRPSGLKIHINTHTGATPFRCPVLGCRRKFNVNSNMLRHYRNHTNSTVPARSNSPSYHHLSSPYSDRPMAASEAYTQLDNPMKKSKSKFVWRPALSSPSFEKDEQEHPRSRLRDVVFARQKYDDTPMECRPSMYEYERSHPMSDIRSARDAYGWETEIGGSHPYARHRSYSYV